MGCPAPPIALNLQFLLLFPLLYFKLILLAFVEPGALHQDTWSSNTPLFTSAVKIRSLDVASALPENGKSLETDVCRKAPGKGAPGCPGQFHLHELQEFLIWCQK